MSRPRPQAEAPREAVRTTCTHPHALLPPPSGAPCPQESPGRRRTAAPESVTSSWNALPTWEALQVGGPLCSAEPAHWGQVIMGPENVPYLGAPSEHMGG